MLKYTLKINGMMCGMCESHINDAIRKDFNVKKVSSSHTKNLTEILCENELDEQKLKQTINNTGYQVFDIKKQNYEKKGLFSFLKK